MSKNARAYAVSLVRSHTASRYRHYLTAFLKSLGGEPANYTLGTDIVEEMSGVDDAIAELEKHMPMDPRQAGQAMNVREEIWKNAVPCPPNSHSFQHKLNGRCWSCGASPLLVRAPERERPKTSAGLNLEPVPSPVKTGVSNPGDVAAMAANGSQPAKGT